MTVFKFYTPEGLKYRIIILGNRELMDTSFNEKLIAL